MFTSRKLHQVRFLRARLKPAACKSVVVVVSSVRGFNYLTELSPRNLVGVMYGKATTATTKNNNAPSLYYVYRKTRYKIYATLQTWVGTHFSPERRFFMHILIWLRQPMKSEITLIHHCANAANYMIDVECSVTCIASLRIQSLI